MSSDKGMKSSIVLLLFLITAFSYSAESYTVVLKNGKVMKGQLLSETEDLLVFKDDQGLQYSLKKSLLDLERMKEANEPPPAPEPVPAPEEIQPPDDTSVSEPQEITQPQQSAEPSTEPAIQPAETAAEIPPPEEISGQLSSSDSESSSYFTLLHEGTSKLENAFEEIESYLDGMMTAWEVNASTGRDPVAALREFKTNKGTTFTASIDALFQVLEKFETRLNDPTVQYSTAFDAFSLSIRDLTEYYNAVRQYDGKPAISVFRSRLSASEQNIQKKIDELKAVKP